MEFSPDELAGIVDLFGALDRPTLRAACVELAFKQGVDRELESFDPEIDDAVDSYHLLVVEADDPEVFVPGPVAFPELPDGARDVPHILDAEDRTVDPDRRASAARRRFEADADAAIAAGDADRIESLLDVSYELDVWGDVDIDDTRERLVAALA